jgi:hypothetical protein
VTLLLACLTAAFGAPITLSDAVKFASESTSPQPASAEVSFTNCADESKVHFALPGLNPDEGLDQNGAQEIGRAVRLKSAIDEAVQVDGQRRICPAVFQAASSYAQLSWVEFELDLLQQEHQTCERLIEIEKKRIVAGVDGEVSLFQAEYLETRSRARESILQEEARTRRSVLAAAIGSPGEALKVQLDSIPEISNDLMEEAELRIAHRENRESRLLDLPIASLSATRDALQLTYVLADRDAVRAVGLGKATLGDQLQAQIRADDKLVDLLEATRALEHTKLEFLSAGGLIEQWAAATDLPPGDEQAARVSPIHPLNEPEAVNAGRSQTEPNKVAPSTPRGPLLLPANERLRVRRSRQLAAISVGIGSGKDITRTVTWSSSNEAVAIVSSFGLITGLRPGKTTISAKFGPGIREKWITVTEEQLQSEK